MKKQDIIKVNINELNEKARRIFEASDQEALMDIFGKCSSIEEINELANDLYNLDEA